MIMNVPSAPEMQGTPMTPDLSMDMQSEMGEISQSEIQEAQGALMQILQVINMLIEQGLNPEQIKAFLEQYGISEDELDQAAQALGVDIDAVLSGQMQAPQEPMMMAEGGPATNVSDRTQSEQLGYSSFRLAVLNPERADSDMIKKDYLESVGPEIYAMDEANILAGREPSEFLQRGIQNFGRFSQNPITVAPSVMSNMSDNEPMMQDRLLKNQMFSTDAAIENLLKQYDISVNTGNIQDAMAISEQITNLINQKIAISEQLDPVMMAEGGSADVGSITPISPFEMTKTFGGPLYQMLNPGAQQMVDRLGLRGQGLAGAAAMAFGPKKVKGGLTALDDLTRGFLAKEKTRLEGVIKSIKEGTDPILKKENLAIYQKQLDDVNKEIAENIRLRKQYDEMVKDPSKFFKTKD